jgi:hypothetical protein
MDGLQSQNRLERFCFVVYFMKLSVFQTSNGRVIGIRKDLEGSGRVLFKVLFRHLPERTEENYEIPQ